MSYEMGVKLGVTLVYFLILIGIGVITSRLINNIRDYFVAGKGLGYWLVSFSSRASGESGWLILGLTGMGFAVGIHAFWVTLGEVLGVMIAWLFMVQRFKLLTDRYDSITIPDYFEDRFHDVQHVIRVVSAVVLSVFVTMYVSGQYVAAGKAFKGFLGMDMTTGILLGMGIVIFYSVAGGFIAVVWSDLIQGILMFFGLTLVPLVALIFVGGPTELFNGIRSIDPILLTISGSAGAWDIPTIFSIIGLISIGWGFLGSPQLFVRFIAIKNNKELVNGTLVAVLFTIFTDAGAVLAGMCGRVLYDNTDWIGMYYGMADVEMVYPMMVEDLFPLWISAIFLAVVLAAIMSTADSLLVVASSAVVRDIYQKIFRPGASQKSLTRLSRIMTLVLSLFALWFALSQGAPKFDVERRRAPIQHLNFAAQVSLPSEATNTLAQLDQYGLEKRWIPGVRTGLNNLESNLKSEEKIIIKHKKEQFENVTEMTLEREEKIMTRTEGVLSVKRQTRQRIRNKLETQIRIVGEILAPIPNTTFKAELQELASDLPEPGNQSEWTDWFGAYRHIVRQALVTYLGENQHEILSTQKNLRVDLLEQINRLQDRFRELVSQITSTGSVSAAEIERFQARLAELSDQASIYYPTSTLKMETAPPVFWFILIGWAGIASAFCPVTILSLYWEKLTRWGAVAGMATGFLVVTFWVFFPMDYILMLPGASGLIEGLGFNPAEIAYPKDIIYEMVPGFLFSFIAIFIVSLVTEPRDQARKDLRQVRDQAVDFWELKP